MALMTAKEFIEKVIVASKAKTAYMWGTYGRPITDNLIERKKKQYPLRYTSARVRKLKALVGKGYFGWDCVGLIKGILWGWDEKVKVPYVANNVPDTNVSGMRKRCTHRSKDFSTIVPGCLLFTIGHVGIYIGGGLAIEATPKWRDGVQITAITNIGKKAGYNNRKWREHGRLPWIDYSDVIKPKPKPEPESKLEPEPAGGDSGIKTAVVEITATIGLNVRSGPGTNYKRIKTLKRRTIIEITKKETDKSGNLWGYAPKHKGYISMYWTKPVATPEPKTATDKAITVQVIARVGLNYRTGAGIKYKKLGTLGYGRKVQVTKQQGGWGYVSSVGGWISMKYTKQV